MSKLYPKAKIPRKGDFSIYRGGIDKKSQQVSAALFSEAHGCVADYVGLVACDVSACLVPQQLG
jgi:hypothetical protein